MERMWEQERLKREMVEEESQADFTVCLTGRPEGHTHAHTQSQRCMFVKVQSKTSTYCNKYS